MTDWSRYPACETCDAHRGVPCVDLRYSARTGRFPNNRPHRGRAAIPRPTTPSKEN